MAARGSTGTGTSGGFCLGSVGGFGVAFTPGFRLVTPGAVPSGIFGNPSRRGVFDLVIFSFGLGGLGLLGGLSFRFSSKSAISSIILFFLPYCFLCVASASCVRYDLYCFSSLGVAGLFGDFLRFGFRALAKSAFVDMNRGFGLSGILPVAGSIFIWRFGAFAGKSSIEPRWYWTVACESVLKSW